MFAQWRGRAARAGQRPIGIAVINDANQLRSFIPAASRSPVEGNGVLTFRRMAAALNQAVRKSARLALYLRNA